MNPDWPFVPVNKDDEDSEEPVYSSFPNEPLRYHFYYTMLDGDGKGRDAKNDKGNLNKDFDHRSKSCLQLLADSAVAEVNLNSLSANPTQCWNLLKLFECV